MTPKEFNDWRIFPRILMAAAYLFCGFGWFYVVAWFMTFDWSSIESELVAAAIAGAPSVFLSVLTTNVGKLTDNYFRTGGTSGNGNGG
jgi:hypothetical protein